MDHTNQITSKILNGNGIFSKNKKLYCFFYTGKITHPGFSESSMINKYFGICLCLGIASSPMLPQLPSYPFVSYTFAKVISFRSNVVFAKGISFSSVAKVATSTQSVHDGDFDIASKLVWAVSRSKSS